MCTEKVLDILLMASKTSAMFIFSFIVYPQNDGVEQPNWKHLSV